VFALYLLFIASLFISGTKLADFSIAGFSINPSPANIIVAGVLFAATVRTLVSIRSNHSSGPIGTAVRQAIATEFSVPKPILHLLILASALWLTSFTYFLKDDPGIGVQPILTGATALASLWFTARSIKTGSQLATVATLYVALMVATATLTILASADLIGIRSLPLVTQPSIEIESFIPGFERDIVFGSGADTFGVRAITAIAILVAVLLIQWRDGTDLNRWAIGATILVAAAIVITQSRGGWISIGVFTALTTLLVATSKLNPRIRLGSVVALGVLIFVGFVLLANLVGGPRRGSEISDFFTENGPPSVAGIELPREFVYNASLRLANYEDAWNVLTSSPFTGAPSDDLRTYNGHSAYVDLIMLAGILPVVLLGILSFYVIRRVRIRNTSDYPLADVATGLIAAILFANLFFLGAFQKDFLIVIGIITLLPELRTESTQSESSRQA